MFNKHRHLYMPPRVLQTPEVLLEKDLLEGSLLKAINMGGVDTTPQIVEDLDLGTGDYNYEWD